MEREIEFRGINGNGFVYGTYINGDGEHMKDRIFLLQYNEKTGEEDGICCPVEPDTVGQYTNVDDKNGKRIYEGDIVAIHDPFCKEPHIGKVEFSKGSFGIRYTVYKDWENFWPLSKTMAVYEAMGCRCEKSVFFEIIGNTYENPELLTKTEKI